MAIHIALDAMGGDLGAAEMVRGAVMAVNEFEDVSVTLVGDEAGVTAALNAEKYGGSRIATRHASQVIGNDESPTAAVKEKKDSSVSVGLGMLKSGEAAAFVSAGSTGALLTGATLIAGRAPGVLRPALATLLPGVAGYTFLIDVGANVDAKPEYLAQFAKMGAVYMERVAGVANPRVGLVNIGAEREKGNRLTKAAFPLLEAAGVNFTGNAEARDIPLSAVDVAVCDAFTGNALLKFAEGFSKAIMGMIKRELTADPLSTIGAAMSGGAFKRLKKRFDYTEVGGAPFLGLKGLVVKAHGSSNAAAIKNAIRQCRLCAEQGVTETIGAAFGADADRRA